jgi:CHAT domain-containing protein
MGGLFRAPAGTPVGEALRQSQTRLMDDPLTSHPYYWAAFAVVGDAAKPITGP